jgi:hypothetical protein
MSSPRPLWGGGGREPYRVQPPRIQATQCSGGHANSPQERIAVPIIPRHYSLYSFVPYRLQGLHQYSGYFVQEYFYIMLHMSSFRVLSVCYAD